MQHELGAGYVTGYLSQRSIVYPATPYFLGGPHVVPCQPTNSCYWSLCPVVFGGSYHLIY